MKCPNCGTTTYTFQTVGGKWVVVDAETAEEIECSALPVDADEVEHAKRCPARRPRRRAS